MGSANSTKIGIFILNQVSRLPFWAIYFLSDLLFVVIYRIMGYRKKVVMLNLRNAFPEKNETELKLISRKYYRHLADVIMETIKMSRMDEVDFRKRMVFKNPELINKFHKQAKNVVVLTMHYNNWEWSSCISRSVQHTILGVYKPLNNPVFDRYLNNTRGRMGSKLVQNSNLLRTLLTARKNEELVLTWLAADQTPPSFHKFWMEFLNQETMFYPGPAAISKRFNHPVFFQKIIKKGRGKYESEFELLEENPKEKTDEQIMGVYISKMEEVIREAPEFYLWSHRRWKHKRPNDIPLTT